MIVKYVPLNSLCDNTSSFYFAHYNVLQDKTKCQCWQLTIQGATLGGKVPDTAVGYVYKRLPEPVTTGIYECNSGCKCSVKTCLNRVVQHPLGLKLQVFKTGPRGWGIRCLNDIPHGAFICIYAGRLLTEQVLTF